MKFVFQFLIIMAFAFAGELLHHFIPLRLVRLISVLMKDIKETSSFLISIMPIMFLPPAVGIVQSWSLIKGLWLPCAVVIVVSTVVVMAVSGRVTQRLVRKGGRK